MNKEFLAKQKEIDELKINKADKADLSILENSIDNLKTEKLDKSDVDNALSPTSENPVQNKVVYEAIQNAGSKITIDNALSPTSENPVQNKVVYAAIQNAGSKITIDNALSPTSENPVQNKVVTQEINISNQNINTLKTRVQAIEDGMNPDISADFLTSEGFGNLRYYNGHFQKYDANSDTWVDTTATPDNVYIFNMVPQAMKKIKGVYDTDLCKYKLKFEEPDDTIIDGQLVCIIDKIIIRRKFGSVPENENDGDFIAEIKRREFGLYKNNWFVDNTLTPNLGDVYYYKVFPVSTLRHINYSTANETTGLLCREYHLYGFKLDQNESDPASMITYLPDCDNNIFSPVFMNYTTDTFDYGDWGDVWFIKNLKPCMLKYDGTVDYELDKDDYTKKADGTPSDVSNTNYEGNAMVGFPKVYWKIVDNGDNTANIYICDKKIDENFVCWSHIDNNGNEIDYCYMPIYNGSNIDNKLRSLSGQAPLNRKTTSEEINLATANNADSNIIWYTELFNDRMLVNLLLILIGKSTDTQSTFGNGRYYTSEGNHPIESGLMDKNGLFYGTNKTSDGVKVFGMEHWWGNIWRRIGGWINDYGTNKIKLTYGQSDGSTANGYSIEGDGYISLSGVTYSNVKMGYISKMSLSNYGLIPIKLTGSDTTYYTDGAWYNNSQLNYGYVGGCDGDDKRVGAFAVSLQDTATLSQIYINTSISCKPLTVNIKE